MNSAKIIERELITGNTYPVKDALRKLGGRWNEDEMGWEVPVSKAAQARELVANAPASEPRANRSFRRRYSDSGPAPTGPMDCMYGDRGQ